MGDAEGFLWGSLLVRQADICFPPVPVRSLKKMTVGMFLASMAFVAAAIVQVEIDVSLLSLGLGGLEETRGLSTHTVGIPAVKGSGKLGWHTGFRHGRTQEVLELRGRFH